MRKLMQVSLTGRAQRFLSRAHRRATTLEVDQIQKSFAEEGTVATESILGAQRHFGGVEYSLGVFRTLIDLFHDVETSRAMPIVDRDDDGQAVAVLVTKSSVQAHYWINAVGRIFFEDSELYSSVQALFESDAMSWEVAENRKCNVRRESMVLHRNVSALRLRLMECAERIDDASDAKVEWWQIEKGYIRTSPYGYGGEEWTVTACAVNASAAQWILDSVGATGIREKV